MKPIDKPDVTCTDKDYWNDILRSHGLTVNRGKYMSHREADALADTIRQQWQNEAQEKQ